MRLEAAVLEPEHAVGHIAQALGVTDDHDRRPWPKAKDEPPQMVDFGSPRPETSPDVVEPGKSRDQARLAVFTYIEGFYNPRRRHSTLRYRSPDRFEDDMIKPDTQTAIAVSS